MTATTVAGVAVAPGVTVAAPVVSAAAPKAAPVDLTSEAQVDPTSEAGAETNVVDKADTQAQADSPGETVPPILRPLSKPRSEAKQASLFAGNFVKLLVKVNGQVRETVPPADSAERAAMAGVEGDTSSNMPCCEGSELGTEVGENTASTFGGDDTASASFCGAAFAVARSFAIGRRATGDSSEDVVR